MGHSVPIRQLYANILPFLTENLTLFSACKTAYGKARKLMQAYEKPQTDTSSYGSSPVLASQILRALFLMKYSNLYFKNFKVRKHQFFLLQGVTEAIQASLACNTLFSFKLFSNFWLWSKSHQPTSLENAAEFLLRRPPLQEMAGQNQKVEMASCYLDCE